MSSPSLKRVELTGNATNDESSKTNNNTLPTGIHFPLTTLTSKASCPTIHRTQRAVSAGFHGAGDLCGRRMGAGFRPRVLLIGSPPILLEVDVRERAALAMATSKDVI